MRCWVWDHCANKNKPEANETSYKMLLMCVGLIRINCQCPKAVFIFWEAIEKRMQIKFEIKEFKFLIFSFFSCFRTKFGELRRFSCLNLLCGLFLEFAKSFCSLLYFEWSFKENFLFRIRWNIQIFIEF